MVKVEEIKLKINNIDNHITNSYIAYDENRNAVVFDPGDEAEKLISKIEELNLILQYVIITHAHADHIGAVEKLVDKFSCKVIVNEYDCDLLFDNINNCANLLNNMNISINGINKDLIIKVKDKEILSFGNLKFLFINTPGHTKGSMCIYEENNNYLFTGDTIFSNCFGRCDLFSASLEDMINSLKRIFNEYSDNVLCFPGHNETFVLKDAKKKIKLFLALKYNIKM